MRGYLRQGRVLHVFRRFACSMEGKQDLDRRPLAFRASEHDAAAKGLDAVAQPDEPGTARRIGAADAVVAHGDAQVPRGSRDVDAHNRRLRVLCRVRQHLGDNLVGGHLDAIREATVGANVESDRDRRAMRDGLQGRCEPALGQDRRMDSARDLT